jgi:hypothetical protein
LARKFPYLGPKVAVDGRLPRRIGVARLVSPKMPAQSLASLPAEAEVIVREIEKIVGAALPTVGDNCATVRSIGVISLNGAEQALHVQTLLMERIGEAARLPASPQ